MNKFDFAGRDWDRNLYQVGAALISSSSSLLGPASKITFDEHRHKYTLGDADGRYDFEVISGSSLMELMRGWLKHGTFKPKQDFVFGLDTMGPKIRTGFTNYLDSIRPSPQAVVTFAERRAKLAEFGCTYYQAVPSIIFKELETRDPNSYENPFNYSLEEDRRLMARLLFDDGDGTTIGPTSKLFRRWYPQERYATKEDLIKVAKVGMTAGTRFHSYIEMLMCGGGDLPEPREPEDAIQAQQIIAMNDCMGRAPCKIDDKLSVELRLGSYRHHVCGTIDALLQEPDGSRIIVDYKRTPTWNEEIWFSTKCAPVLSTFPPSSDLIKYAVQQAVYYKLCRLNGIENCKPMAELYVVHPTLSEPHRVILDYTQMLPEKMDKYMEGFGSTRYGLPRYNVITFVEMMFDQLERRLNALYPPPFNKTPRVITEEEEGN